MFIAGSRGAEDLDRAGAAVAAGADVVQGDVVGAQRHRRVGRDAERDDVAGLQREDLADRHADVADLGAQR